MKSLKVLIGLFFISNIVLLALSFYLNWSYAELDLRFQILSLDSNANKQKIIISDSDSDLFIKAQGPTADSRASHANIISPPGFLLPDQHYFWNRWTYSLLSSMSDQKFFRSLTQVKNISYFNSGFFSDHWMQGLYSPIAINDSGLLDLEILIISWILSDNQYKVTLQYDFYYTNTNKRFYEHVVNVVFKRSQL